MSTDQEKTKGPEVPWTQSNGIYADYNLHCHCGAICFNMRLSPPLYKEQTEGKEQCIPVECDCSHCERTGLIAIHPLAKDVKFTQGLEDLVEYYSGAKKNPHWFCNKCGSTLGTDLTWLMKEVFRAENRYTINVRLSRWTF